MDRYYIYKIENTINGKIYIGKRKCPLVKSPEDDSYFGSGAVLRDAIKEYGINNFKKIILKDHISSNQSANTHERYYIKKHNSTNRNIGYNRTAGGDGGHLTEFYTEEEQKIYKSKLTGRRLSQETKDKISKKMKGHIVQITPEKRKLIAEKLRHPTLQTRKKLSDAGRKTWSSGSRKRRKIRCINHNIIFDSIGSATEHMGDVYYENCSTALGIYKVCLGYRKSYKGKKWEYCDG